MRRVSARMEKVPDERLMERKWLSLSCFILQNSLLILGLKACTINSSHSMNQYIASTAVILSEVLKFILSATACYVFDAKCNVAVFRDMVYTIVMDEGADALKLCVPALLYTIQNNLQYVIEEAPLFLVLYQAKIITTAIFYSTLLSRRLSTKEWACIIALCLGVSMVESSQVEVVPNHASNVTGVIAVVFACLSSGVAGVSFEKILKSSRSSIWMINMQMSLLSAFFCTSVALTQDSLEIARHGVFTGYNPLVLLSIVLQAITGLAVALVVKYADNIYKGFGHSISLVFCHSLSSVVFEDISMNETFMLGSFMVLVSSVAYASLTAQQLPALAHRGPAPSVPAKSAPTVPSGATAGSDGPSVGPRSSVGSNGLESYSVEATSTSQSYSIPALGDLERADAAALPAAGDAESSGSRSGSPVAGPAADSAAAAYAEPASRRGWLGSALGLALGSSGSAGRHRDS